MLQNYLKLDDNYLPGKSFHPKNWEKKDKIHQVN